MYVFDAWTPGPLLTSCSSCVAACLQVCRANGGVYIKAGQFASAFGAVPIEYRRQLACLEDRATPRPYQKILKVDFPSLKFLIKHSLHPKMVMLWTQ